MTSSAATRCPTRCLRSGAARSGWSARPGAWKSWPTRRATPGRAPLSSAAGHGDRFRHLLKLGRTWRAHPEGRHLQQHRRAARHGALGRRATARAGLDDAAGREHPPRLLLRLSQRRSGPDLPELAADRPGARGPPGRVAGHRLLQAERRVPDRASAADRCAWWCQRPTASSPSSGCSGWS